MIPYPGLRPFDGEYSRFFFGRDRQVLELIDRLRSNRFLAVVGLSGSGKSSLVRAGLLPALRAGQLGRVGSEWRMAVIRPSEQPIAMLAAELNKIEVLGPSPDREELLERSTFGLLEGTRSGRMQGTNLLVCVDQFEDVFRLVKEGKLDADRATHFINLLLAVSDESQLDLPVYVVVTLRSEYLGDCARYYGLPEALNHSQYLVPRLTPEQLREVIEAPAALCGVEFETGLVQLLYVQASTTSDELPRLQHLLMRLWEQRTGDIITLEQYWLPGIGGLEQAMGIHAEEVYSRLTDAQKGIAKRIFQRLTTWGESGRDARRPTTLSELAAVSGTSYEADLKVVTEVVDRFRAPHFLSQIPAARGREPLVDLAHESLIRNWRRLEHWAKEEARFKEIFLALAGTKRPLWNEVDVDEAIQWRDKLQPTEIWAQRYASRKLETSLKELRRLESDLAAAIERRIQGTAEGQENSLAKQLAVSSVALLPASAVSHIPAALLAIESMKRLPLPENHAALRQSTVLIARQVSRVAHDGAVYAVAFSPNGELLVTGCSDNLVRVLESDTGEEKSRFAHQGLVIAVAFSPDGKWVVSGSYDNTARVIEAATGKEVSRLTRQGRLLTVAFSPDGRWVATGGYDKAARVTEATTGREVSCVFHDRAVYSLAFSPDGKWLATGSGDRTARVIEAATGTEFCNVTVEGPVSAVAFSPDNKLFAIGCAGSPRLSNDGVDRGSESSVRVVEVLTGKEVFRFVHQRSVNAVAFSNHGKWVATGGGDNTARVMEVATGMEVARIGHQGPVNAIAFSQDSQWLATCSDDKTARVIDVETGKETCRHAHGARVRAVAFRQDGKWIATGSYDNTSRVMETTTGKAATRLEPRGGMCSMIFSRDGKWLATAGDDSTARVIDTANGKEVACVIHQGSVKALAFSSDGKWMVTGSWDGTTRVMEAATGRGVSCCRLQSRVTAVSFSPDSNWIAVAAEDKTVRLFHAATGEEVSRLISPCVVVAVAFSRDGRSVATGSATMLRVMDATTGREISSRKHQGVVGALVFSLDDRWLAAGSQENTALVLEKTSLMEVSRLSHQGPVSSLSFSHDGKWLATGSEDKIARVIDAASGQEIIRHPMQGRVSAVSLIERSILVAAQTSGKDYEISNILTDPADLIQDACNRISRNLSPEEWERYLPGEPYRATCPNPPDTRRYR